MLDSAVMGAAALYAAKVALIPCLAGLAIAVIVLAERLWRR